jgi:hypothetical protein
MDPDVPDHSGLPAPQRSGRGLWGWLGRQIGYVRSAVRTDVTAPKPRTVWRKRTIEQEPLPGDESVTLRRTTIDEVIVKPPKPPQAGE